MMGEKGTHETVGTLSWDPSGEIKNIQVKPENRRQGIATKMLRMAEFETARRGTPPIQHSSRRTDDGDAWAKSVGGKLPPRTKAD